MTVQIPCYEDGVSLEMGIEISIFGYCWDVECLARPNPSFLLFALFFAFLFLDFPSLIFLCDP